MFFGSFHLLGSGSWKPSGGEVKKKFIVFISTTCRLSTCFLGFFLAEFFIFSVISQALIFGFIVTRKYIIP